MRRGEGSGGGRGLGGVGHVPEDPGGVPDGPVH